MRNLKESKPIILSELLIDATIDRVMAIDLEWRIIAWNRSSEIISGIPKAEILQKNVFEVFPGLEDDEEFVDAFKSAMEGNKSFLLPDHRFEHRRYYENHFIPLRDEEGSLIGVMDLMHDVSHRIKGELELKRLHQALKDQYDHLEKTNAELAIFTSITGKDLKEPVRKLYTGLEMLVHSDGKKLSDNSKAGLRRMQASLTKMSLLLDDIMAFSSGMNFDQKFVPLHLNEILETVLSSLSAKIIERKAIIEAGQLPEYNGSVAMLHYLFYQIIDNALKFQAAENIPIVKISSSMISAESDASHHPEHSRCFICVSFTDNGIGFAKEEGKRIFKMFERLQTRKQFPGAGIGLTISQKIAEAHGGYIEADSMQDKGSVFRCYLAVHG